MTDFEEDRSDFLFELLQLQDLFVESPKELCESSQDISMLLLQQFFARRELVTIFSAPNYCGEFDNAAAMMTVDESLMCSFQILKPADWRSRRRQRVVRTPGETSYYREDGSEGRASTPTRQHNPQDRYLIEEQFSSPPPFRWLALDKDMIALSNIFSFFQQL